MYGYVIVQKYELEEGEGIWGQMERKQGTCVEMNWEAASYEDNIVNIYWICNMSLILF